MAKITAERIDQVEINYNLFDLPTAQHKAGLAGLVLQIESMRSRGIARELIPKIVGEVGAATVAIRFTEASLQSLMDDVYAARIVKVEVKARWPGEAPLEEKFVDEIDENSGQIKRVKRFVYEVVQPRGIALEGMYPDGDGLYLKLWRDMLWNIPRSKPTTRGPFNTLAQNKPCTEGSANWKALIKCESARRKGRVATDEISGALLLGAQAVNAESVPFNGRVEQTLLLHFWPLTVLIFVPQVIDNDGSSEFAGYSIAIPEVSDLAAFVEDFVSVIQRLPAERRGYRPLASVIDLPEQSAVEFLQHLGALAGFQAERGGSRRLVASVSSIEYLHLVKLGNNVKLQASGRVAPNPALLADYFEITRRAGFRNPLFRACLLRSLLDAQRQPTPWFAHFANLLQSRPWPMFVQCAQTPRSLPWFSSDARQQFQRLATAYRESLDAYHSIFTPPLQENVEMPPDPTSLTADVPRAPLESLVYGLVRNYVNRKTTDKCNISWEEIAKRPKIKDAQTGAEKTDIPKDYREAREKIASSAFLAMRSRREQDFVDYFTATICSVGQYLPREEFVTVAQALIERPDDVKTLTLLALSANS